jgi:peptidoglycan/xylan/chitin deacetylase (PgdA/CDA1 family)
VIRTLAHRLRRAADRALHPGGRGVVLLYHRVADEPSDPYALCITPAAFEEHLQAICATGRPMRLSDLADAVARDDVPDRAVCVTFDDGYADNVDVGEPLLQRYGVPATMFVTTGRAGREREFWWDELERIFLQTPALPDTLELDLGGTTLRCAVGPLATTADSITDGPRATRAWHLLDVSTPGSRRAAFRLAYDAVQQLAPDDRDRAMDALVAWADVAPAVRPARRALEPDEVAAMDARGVFDVGAHTVTHPALPRQAPDVQRAEIERSKRDLEAWTGHEVPGFAYPYGLYDEPAVHAVRASGFRYACSCIYRHVQPDVERFLLPRIEITSGDGDEVARQLRWQLR